MHKLERGNAPNCLRKFRHGRHTWGHLSHGDRAEIWAALDAMQGQRCAYCEADISGGKKHIDHFRQKAAHRYPQGTFEWSNLFGSCCFGKSCANHKDAFGNYAPEDLIKPDEEDPEEFFIFAPDGTIVSRGGLSSTNQRRASATLQILNLNGPLRHVREQAIFSHSQTIEQLCQLAENSPEKEWLPFLEEELEQINSLPFATALKHALTSQVGVAVSGIEQ